MLTHIPNGLDEVIHTYGSLDDPQFEGKHLTRFDLPYQLKYEGKPVTHALGHMLAVDNFIKAFKNVEAAGLANQFVEYNGIYARRAIRGQNAHVDVREKWEIIKKGNRGSDVKEVQRKLGIGIDGKFGPDTETAVKQFQAAHGLVVDGVVGEHTWPLLDSLSSTSSNFAGKGLALDEAGFSDAMSRMTVGAPELWAVMKIETNGFGFLRDRRPVILYERHIFSKKTNHQFDASHPDISNPVGGGYGAGGAHQYDRLERAISLNRTAALESAS